MRLPAVAAAAALAVGACAGLPTPVEKPTVDVRDISIDSITMSSVSGQVGLDVFNPNGFGVPLRSGTWTLTVGDADAVNGRFDLTKTIPAKATAPVRAALHIDAADALAVGSQVTRGKRSYVVTGVLQFSTKLGPVDVAFRHEGQITDATGARSPLSLFGQR